MSGLPNTSSEPLNVVLITADQWRGDCLSIDGHDVVRTPYLDALAARGVRFTSAYSATPTCIPARTALMTGLSQQSHLRVGYEDGVPWQYPVTLAGEFRHAGYQTKAIGKLHVYPERTRIGFDDVVLHEGYMHAARRLDRAPEEYDDYLPWLRDTSGSGHADYADDGLDCNSMIARPWSRAEELHPTGWLAGEAVRWLSRRDRTVPFFLYMSFHRPHPPFDPPGWAFDQYVAAPQYEPVVGDWWTDYEQQRDDYRPNAMVARRDAATLQRARAGYFGNMTHVDAQINRFVTALAEAGLDENTLVVFTSDHGEMLGEHNLYGKGLPYEGSARVPLIVKGPEYLGFEAGGVCRETVELRDVMPTLLETAGVPVPDGLDGSSLVPLMQGRDVPWRTYLHGEHTMGHQSLQWCTDGRMKYCWLSGSGAEHLFDLVADPQESRNLASTPEFAGTLQKWRARLVDELRSREEGYVVGNQLVPGREPKTLLSDKPSQGMHDQWKQLDEAAEASGTSTSSV